MNTPQFKISGLDRRKIKKELSESKRYVKYFWHFHQLDKDMTGIYGGSVDYPMTDGRAQALYDNELLKIKFIEKQLAEKYGE